MARTQVGEMVGLFKKPWRTLIYVGLVAGVLGMLVGSIAVIMGAVVAGAPAFVVALLAVVTLGFFIGIPVFIFFVFRSFLGPEVARRNLLANGEPAEATVISLAETGFTVNRIYPMVDLELEVRRTGQQPYRVKSRFMVSRLDVPQIQPGSVIGVTVNRDDPSEVAIGAGPAAAAQVSLSPEQERETGEWLKKLDDANQELIARGVGSAATILAATPLGILVNGENPAMKFLLEVLPGDRPSFKAEATAFVAEASVSKYQPGQTIYVKFDPDDLTRVAVEHS